MRPTTWALAGLLLAILIAAAPAAIAQPAPSGADAPPAPDYDWQPPGMILFLAALAAPLLFAFRRRLARGLRLVRVWLDHAWARVLRARFRLIEARGLPRRLARRVGAVSHRLRWRAARALARARRRRPA